MSDDLLPWYNRELSYVRRQAAQFAEAHPKIASRLRLGPDSTEDPHVERLIEAFAYLTARVRRKLDDDFPEITEALLGVLYPHYQRPIPSMAIVQLELNPEQKELPAGHTVPRHSPVETEPIQGEPCRFRTGYPVTLWPVEVRAGSLGRPPFQAPATPYLPEAASVLRLSLACRAKAGRFADLEMDSLRFFLKGQAQHVYRLYELIFNNVVEVAVANGPDDRNPVLLDADCLRPVGFERDEGLLPYTARSFVGYRLLSEFFAFPLKYLFFDAAWGRRALARIGNRLEVYFYLNQAVPDLEQYISADTFRLGCTPVVNLYRRRAEPIRLTHTETEYRVVPDARRPLAHEVYSVERVTATAPDGGQVEYRPFFSVRHAEDDQAQATYWHASRRGGEGGAAATDHGTEIFLALVDLDRQPSVAPEWTVDVETVCCNRDLPNRLPFGGDQPRLQLADGDALVSRVVCLTPPTRTFRPALRQGALWRLISHLSLGHLSLEGTDDKALALREILKLYDFADSAETRTLIDGVTRVHGRRVAGRVRRGPADAFCQGIEITVQFDEDKFTGNGLFLFAGVLERFLALYSSLNSFTRLVATLRGREGELRRWAPRLGEKVLI
jgi:type VI secretion system protein ImpG